MFLILQVKLRTEVQVPSALVGRIIGKGGQNVRELQRVTGAQVRQSTLFYLQCQCVKPVCWLSYCVRLGVSSRHLGSKPPCSGEDPRRG